MTKGLSPPTTSPCQHCFLYKYIYTHNASSPIKAFCGLTTLYSHEMVNRLGPYLALVWQERLGNSLLWQFTDFRVCFPACHLKDMEEPPLVQRVQLGNSSLSSTASLHIMFQSRMFPAIKVPTELNNQTRSGGCCRKDQRLPDLGETDLSHAIVILAATLGYNLLVCDR